MRRIFLNTREHRLEALTYPVRKDLPYTANAEAANNLPERSLRLFALVGDVMCDIITFVAAHDGWDITDIMFTKANAHTKPVLDRLPDIIDKCQKNRGEYLVFYRMISGLLEQASVTSISWIRLESRAENRDEPDAVLILHADGTVEEEGAYAFFERQVIDELNRACAGYCGIVYKNLERKPTVLTVG